MHPGANTILTADTKTGIVQQRLALNTNSEPCFPDNMMGCAFVPSPFCCSVTGGSDFPTQAVPTTVLVRPGTSEVYVVSGLNYFGFVIDLLLNLRKCNLLRLRFEVFICFSFQENS
jgi:hypothetical protein